MALGLAPVHLNEAMTEIARHLLALGSQLMYGGDLRPEGFSQVLFELVARYRRDAELEDGRTGVVNYLAWPVHRSMPKQLLRMTQERLVGVADLVLLDLKGRPQAFDLEALDDAVSAPSEEQWATGLTAMREMMSTRASARIVMGGRVSDYRGRMPGVTEEAVTSLMRGRPLFILGGFGGAARDLAEALGLVDRWVGSRELAAAPYLKGLRLYGEKLYNGLSRAENERLAATPFVDEAIALILKGLGALAKPANTR
jgi:hypothetical protein